MKIAIVGLGYVGLPLAMRFAQNCVTVLGLDIDLAKVDALNQGTSFLSLVSSEKVAESVRSGSFCVSSDFSRINEGSAVIICAPTLPNRNRESNVCYILEMGTKIARHLRNGVLVVLESTPSLDPIEADLREVLEIGSGMEAGRDFHLAFSPDHQESHAFGSKDNRTPKLVGGFTPTCLQKVVELYSRGFEVVLPISPWRTTESEVALARQNPCGTSFEAVQ